MDFSAFQWLKFGLILAGEVVFASGVAWLRRYFVRAQLEGQTFWLVCLGVGGVIVIAAPVIGWEDALVLLAAFAAAALPMGGEYFSRVARESREAVKTLLEMAGDDEE